jgi:hypothetical protein
VSRVRFLRELWDQGGEKQRFCERLADAYGGWEKACERWWKRVTDFLGADEISYHPRKERFALAEEDAIKYFTQALNEGGLP